MIKNILFWDDTKSNMRLEHFLVDRTPSVVLLIEEGESMLDALFKRKGYDECISMDLKDGTRVKCHYKKNVANVKPEDKDSTHYYMIELVNRKESVIAVIDDSESIKSSDELIKEVKENCISPKSVEGQIYIGIFDRSSKELGEVVCIYNNKNNNENRAKGFYPLIENNITNEDVVYVSYMRRKFLEDTFITDTTLSYVECGVSIPCIYRGQKSKKVKRIPVELELA